ncbi:hypothetical protein ABC439_35670, partial [Pseudomonas aeruginosa]|uniref:hypothetical protein n=1 Tax=Pseudomonas aeruginosa TaxID=287 RepID=UPI0031F644EE
TVHQQFPAGFFNTLTAPARIIRVRFAARAGENNFGVIEMRFASEVKTFSKWFGKRDIGDGAAVGQTAERRLQPVATVRISVLTPLALT